LSFGFGKKRPENGAVNPFLTHKLHADVLDVRTGFLS
jgi:hypothetical protein